MQPQQAVDYPLTSEHPKHADTASNEMSPKVSTNTVQTTQMMG